MNHEASHLNRRLTWNIHNEVSDEGNVKHREKLLRAWGIASLKLRALVDIYDHRDMDCI